MHQCILKKYRTNSSKCKMFESLNVYNSYSDLGKCSHVMKFMIRTKTKTDILICFMLFLIARQFNFFILAKVTVTVKVI